MGDADGGQRGLGAVSVRRKGAMIRLMRHDFLAAGLTLCLGILGGCGSDAPVNGSGGTGSVDSGNGNEPGSSESPESGGEALPDFSVTDVNPNSVRYREAVSPRDYLGQISAWYFGHAT